MSTEDLVAYLRNALSDAPDGIVTFEHLSDEETAVIETDDQSGFTVQPWIESQKHLDAESASLFGRRSLYLRGFLTIGPDPETGEETLLISDRLNFIADTRRLGVGYILARALHRGERTARNNVLQSQIGTYEEDIDTDGFHHLSVCTYRTALRRLAEWALPQPHVHDEFRATVPENRWVRWTAKKLGPDVRTIEINMFLPDGTGNYDASNWLCAHGNGSTVLAEPNGKQLNVASTSASRLEYLLADQLARGLAVQI